MPSSALRPPLPRGGCLRSAQTGGAFLRPHSFLSLYRERKEPPRPVKKRKRTFEVGSANCAAIASEEACSIAFPPGRRKLHIRSLLLPSQIVTVSLGHNLAIWNFTTPHAILMMALRQHLRIRFVGADAPVRPARCTSEMRSPSAKSYCPTGRQSRRPLQGAVEKEWGRECYSSFAQSKARWTARCQPWRRASRDFASSCGSNVRSTAQILRISA